MAATSGSALKALIEAAGLGIAVYRDRQPENEALPYAVVRESLATNPEAAFSQLDDPEGHVAELVQVDLWEHWRTNPPHGPPAHSFTLPDALARVLRGAQLPDAPTHVSGVRLVDGPQRFIEVEPNLLHHVYTVELRRVLERDEGS